MQQHIKKLINLTINKLCQENILPDSSYVVKVDPVKNTAHGNFYSNIALSAAKHLKMSPTKLAEIIVSKIPPSHLIKKIEIASPGFINFYLSEEAYCETINAISTLKEKFGFIDIGKNKSVIVEFVSANPTGPLHVGHGRGAAFGATVANLLKTIGFRVHSEYYVNDSGRQINVLTLSIWLRYLELASPLPGFPESGYKGEYIINIAKQLKAEYGNLFYRSPDILYQNLPSSEDDSDLYIDSLILQAQQLLGEQNYKVILQAGVDTILADIKSDLEDFGVTYDEWFRESHLIKNGDVTKGINKLKDKGVTYLKDGALWFRATEFGDEKDRVLVRANKQTTYFASDVGYHLNKYERKFGKIIDIFGSDHHGYVPRIMAFLKALDLETDRLEILLVQFAILYRGNQKVQMSTRSGEFVTLRQLREEVGNDAARFFYIMHKNDQHLDFDIELAKSHSINNPVYYVQYAHARICSVLRQLEEKQLVYNNYTVTSLDGLREKQELHILHRLVYYPTVLQQAAINYEPHLLARYLQELSSDFHSYYSSHQFLVDDDKIRDARLSLINAIKQILANGLNLLGVSAPEMM